MASTNLVVILPNLTGQTLTIELYAVSDGTVVNATSKTLTETGDSNGVFAATITEALVGVYRHCVFLGTDAVAYGEIYIEDDTATWVCDSMPSETIFWHATLTGSVDGDTLSPTTTVFETATLNETDDDQYNNQALRFTTGTNKGRTTFISASEGTTANANNKVKLTVQALPTAPAAGDRFHIMGTRVQA